MSPVLKRCVRYVEVHASEVSVIVDFVKRQLQLERRRQLLPELLNMRQSKPPDGFLSLANELHATAGNDAAVLVLLANQQRVDLTAIEHRLVIFLDAFDDF